MQPAHARRLLLMVTAARPTHAEVPPGLGVLSHRRFRSLPQPIRSSETRAENAPQTARIAAASRASAAMGLIPQTARFCKIVLQQIVTMKKAVRIASVVLPPRTRRHGFGRYLRCATFEHEI